MRGVLTIQLAPDDLPAFRLMLREMLAGDGEHLADLQEFGEGEASPLEAAARRARVEARMELVDRLADEVGGLTYCEPV